jgi:hypothetical protein
MTAPHRDLIIVLPCVRAPGGISIRVAERRMTSAVAADGFRREGNLHSKSKTNMLRDVAKAIYRFDKPIFHGMLRGVWGWGIS